MRSKILNRIMISVLASVMAFSLIGCSGKGGNASDESVYISVSLFFT